MELPLPPRKIDESLRKEGSPFWGKGSSSGPINFSEKNMLVFRGVTFEKYMECIIPKFNLSIHVFKKKLMCESMDKKGEIQINDFTL